MTDFPEAEEVNEFRVGQAIDQSQKELQLDEEPYVETDAISPVGVYGKSKAQGEAEIKNNLKQHIILRTSWVYGIHGHNFVKTMINLAKTRKQIRVVDDQIGCPSFARDIAKAILTIADNIQRLKKPEWGLYHYCGKGAISWFGFAKKIFEIAKNFEPLAVKQIVPIRTDEYPTVAKRPANSALNCDLIHQHFGIIQTPWQQSLEEMITDLYTVCK